jgi:hypothetical protein
MNRTPKTPAELAKIEEVKKHYAAIKNGSAPCFGADMVIKTKARRHAPVAAAAAPAAPAPEENPREKLWTIVNNSVRKSKWKKYYDPEDVPHEELEESTGAWADLE